MNKRVLVIGSGLLGCTLKDMLSQRGIITKITMRSESTDKNITMKTLKLNFKNALSDSAICDELNDYHKVVNEFKPDWTIITLPLPPDDLLKYLLTIDNCSKIYISSPASDEARNSSTNHPYAATKLAHEKLTNQYKQIALQIGFIPELGEINGKLIPSGLSLKTMVICNLKTRLYDDMKILSQDDQETIKCYLENFDISSGFTCTSIKNVSNFCFELITGKLEYPKELIGRTIAMHSDQVWHRYQIINALMNPSFKNTDQLCSELTPVTKPVKEFTHAFGNQFNVSHNDILIAIHKAGVICEQHKTDLIAMILEYAKDQNAKL